MTVTLPRATHSWVINYFSLSIPAYSKKYKQTHNCNPKTTYDFFHQLFVLTSFATLTLIKFIDFPLK